MHLTSEQEKMLKGEYGWAVAKAMEIIVRVGEAIGAESLVEIKHAHVSGISFSNIGKYGLEFIEAFSSAGESQGFYNCKPWVHRLLRLL